MKPDDQSVLRRLLTEVRVLSLGVLVDGEPHVGLLPFAVEDGFSSALVHASQLARHSRGLRTGAPFSALIHGPDGEGDPLQVPRVTISGRVQRVDRASAEYDGLRDLYIARFPTSQQTFALGDFGIYRLEFEKGRLVAGFARAQNLSRETFADLCSSRP